MKQILPALMFWILAMCYLPGNIAFSQTIAESKPEIHAATRPELLADLSGSEPVLGNAFSSAEFNGDGLNISYNNKGSNEFPALDGSWTSESAWGGPHLGNPPGQWYYFETSLPGVQPIYAGQDRLPGAWVSHSDEDGGTITIYFPENVTLEDTSEPVKIKGFDTPPDSKPTYGQFSLKGNELIVEQVGNYPYYVIKLDLKIYSGDPEEVTLEDFDPVCYNTEPFELFGGYPLGGEYSGSGVVDNIFDPYMAGPGIHEITYTATLDGEEGSATANLEVWELPCVEIEFTNITCYGANNGTITVTSQECGNTPYDITLENVKEGIVINQEDNKSQFAHFSGLIPGDYYIIITDQNGCTIVEAITLTEADDLLLDIDVTQPSCHGDLGSAVITPSGGTPPYEIHWEGLDPGNLPPGQYEILVTDANDCYAWAEFTIVEPDEIELTIETTDVTCYGAMDGTATLTIEGGTPPYDLDWGGADPDALDGGTYQVVVTDANDCMAVAEFEIFEPELLTVEAIVTPIVCYGDLAQVELIIEGGTEPYTIDWDGITDPDAVEPGTYTIVVTDDNGCMADVTIEIEGTSPIEITNIAVTHVACYGEETGSIEVDASGGTGFLTYSLDGENYQFSNVFENLTAGIYTLYVIDELGCEKIVEDIEITQPDELVLNLEVTHVTCFGADDGIISGTVAGGVSPYDVCLEVGCIDDLNIPDLDFEKSSVFEHTGLKPGDYTVVITDANGCVVYECVTVEEPEELVADVEVIQPVCHDDVGQAEITVSGGTAPYQIHWDGLDPDNLPAGDYNIMVTDANDCAIWVEFTINEAPDEILVTVETTDASCYEAEDGTATLTIEGGVPPYDVDWAGADPDALGAGTYQVSITDALGCEVWVEVEIFEPELLTVEAIITPIDCYGGLAQVELVIEGGIPPYNIDWNGITDPDAVEPGTYTIVVTDDNNCTAETTIEIIEPDPLSIDGEVQDVLCYGEENGQITITVTGGTEPYSYNWNNGEFTTQNLENIGPGTYTLEVTDANGCTVEETFEVNEPEPLTATFDVTHVTCFAGSDGAIVLSVDGGTGDYSFLWSNGETTQDLYDIPAGNYSVTITDENDCELVLEDIEVMEPEGLDITIEVTHVTCFGESNGAITLIIDGDTDNLDFLWSNGETTQNLEDIPAGIYSVTITDENDCELVLEDIEVTEPDAIAATYEVSDVSCYGAEDGAIALTVEGGTGEYSFLWSNGETTQDLADIPAGIYSITITDENDCELVLEDIEVVEPDAITASYEVTDVSCHGASDGAIALTVDGGAGNFSFLWSNGETTQDLMDIPAGIYSVTITDENDCELVLDDIEVVEPDAIEITAVITHVENYGEETGAIETTVTGGTPPYTYLWSNGETTPDIFDLPAGEYTLTVTDDNGCTAEETFEVTQPDQMLDLGLELVVDNPTPDSLDVVTFTLTLTNYSSSIDATGVQVLNLLPDIFDYQGHTRSSYDPVTGVWDVGMVPAGASTELIVEAIVTDSGDNTACIIAVDQPDSNPANDCAAVGVAMNESSGGDDGGIESDGNMASQIALRHHRRLVEGSFIEKAQRQMQMQSFSHLDMLVGETVTARTTGQEATGISYFIPEHGPANTSAFISTPSDLIGITNAQEIFAVDYLQEDNSRRAAILAIATGAEAVYEHTKVICDRLTGATLESIQHIEVAGQKFILSKLVHPNGYVDYSVSFIATRTLNGFTIDNRWHNEEYNIRDNTSNIFNFQVWSVTPQFTRELVEDILEEMKTTGSLTFKNETDIPQIPQVFVKSGEYRNGKLLLDIANNAGANHIKFYGSRAVVENGEREWFEINVNIPTTPEAHVEVPIGYIFDAGFSITNNKDNAMDVLYYADGPWMFDYDPGNATVSSFNTEPETGTLLERSYNIERDASFSGQVRTWTSMFRRLGPGTLPYDMTEYDQIAFTAHGKGETEVMLAKKGIKGWHKQYRTVITLRSEPREYRINFSDLVTAEGESGFSAEDIISVIFNPLGNGSILSDFEVNISNLHFTSSIYSTNQSGIYYPSYPNPFRHSTNIEFALTQDNHVRIEILNMFGQVVDVLRDELMTQGNYKVTWTPSGNKTGIYMFRITAGRETHTGKMIYQR